MRQAAGLSSAQVIALMVITAEHCTPCDELSRDLGVGVGVDELDDILAPLLTRGWLTVDRQAYTHHRRG